MTEEQGDPLSVVLGEDPITISKEEIPVGVSVDGEIIPPKRVLDLAEHHFMDEVKHSGGAIGHELLSMAPAAGILTYAIGQSAMTLSTAPLVEHWGNGLSLALSIPILATLFEARTVLRNDLHRVHRVREHFKEHNDPKILHAMAFQLENYEDGDPEPEVCKLDYRAYHSTYCIESHIGRDGLEKAGKSIRVDEKEFKNWFEKTGYVSKHIVHDLWGVLSQPKAFAKDISDGWSTLSLQAWYGKRRLYDKFSEAAGSVFKNSEVNPVPEENAAAVDNTTEHERFRLQRARERLAGQMKNTGVTFPLENGFVVVETINGINYFGQGDLQGSFMGAAHIFSAMMGLRPAQLLARRHNALFDNYHSERSRAAASVELQEPSVG